MLVERTGPLLLLRNSRTWQVVTTDLAQHASLFSQAGDPATVPEVFRLRETLRQWRLYAGFRTDAEAAARGSVTATRTPVLHPELIAPLARLIGSAEHSQVWVISHSQELVRGLEPMQDAVNHVLEKSLGQTVITGQSEFDVPPRRWG